jgi:hypothetical protein
MAKKRKKSPPAKKIAAKKRTKNQSQKTQAARRAPEKKRAKRPLSPEMLRRKRSKASKKGWVTRRQAQRVAPSPEVVETANSIMVEAVKKFGRKAILDEFAMIRSDGTPAKEPSILRHVPERDDILSRLRESAEEEADEEGWILDNDKAVAGTESFHAEALRIKREYELDSVREVYTLFFST